jgi:hypothetical protein
MGGFGSGRKSGYIKKQTVEQCFTLSTRELLTGDVFSNAGTTRMLCAPSLDREELFVVLVSFDDNRLQLKYVAGTEDKRTGVIMHVQVQRSRPNFGGYRYWLECPVKGCGRRVCTLHLPPGERIFACRYCHDLTYRACQEEHRIKRLSEYLHSRAPGESTLPRIRRLLRRHPIPLIGPLPKVVLS